LRIGWSCRRKQVAGVENFISQKLESRAVVLIAA
jgi:hypothetical protein